MRQHTRPLWLAAVISPWAAPIAFMLYFAGHDLLQFGTLAFRNWAEVTFNALLLMLPGSYAATCLLGLPYILWLRTRHALSIPSVCAGATIAGLLAAFVYAWAFGVEDAAPDPVLIRTGVVTGLACGLSFCVLAGVRLRRSPAGA